MFCTARWFGAAGLLVLSLTMASSTACAGTAREVEAKLSERDAVTELAEGVMGAFGRARPSAMVEVSAPSAAREPEEVIVVYANREEP